MFFAGAVLAVLVILTVVDEDVLNVEHVLSIMTILGLSRLLVCFSPFISVISNGCLKRVVRKAKQ